MRGRRFFKFSPIASATPPFRGGSVDAPDADGVRAQLARILGSADFDATKRSRKLLGYIVEEGLAGRSDRIKAYSIATDVFARDASFDPSSDPIVRVEAGHLRRALNLYYATAGASDPIVISVPKGSYVPKFEALPEPTSPEPPAVTRARWRLTLPVAIGALSAVAILSWLAADRMRDERPQAPAMPRLLVMPFDDLTGRGSSKTIAQGVTREVIGQIAKFKDIVTIEGSSHGEPAQATADGPRYALLGDVDIDDNQFRVRAHVLSRTDNAVIWANTYGGDLKASKLIDAEAEIARQVATSLGQPYGVIFQADASQRPHAAPDDWQAYACTLSYYSYRATFDAMAHPSVRKCLEDAVQRFPNYATAWALLSQIYVDEIRFRFPTDPSSSPASIDRALDAARRAVALDPENIRALQAEMFALYFHGEVDSALKVGEQAYVINPNDTELLGEYGYRLALAGNWSRGCALLDEARKRNPGPLAYYETGLAVCSYFKGDLREATMWINKTPTPANPNYHMIAAAIYAESGNMAEAARERDWLLTHAPHLVANLRSELALRVIRAEDVDHVLQSLQKAGIPPQSVDRSTMN